MTQDKVVISIGGSILIPDDHDDTYIAALAALLKEMSAKVQFTVVCGGGKIARYYTDTGRALGG
ncbi:MAG: UMP kinase, partial [Candidatus Methanomethylophilus sp.]|nr:UMP kinase [Methanomethylophilus sp.]